MTGFGEGWDVPVEVRDRVQFHWFHVAPGQCLVLVVLSNKPLWYVGHFRSGRMQPCERNGCQSCAAGIGRQIRFVVSCVEITTKRMGVLEVSESVGQLIRSWAQARDGSRGLILELRKATRSKHSRMEVERIDEHPPAWALAMEPLDLQEVVARTWEKISG